MSEPAQTVGGVLASAVASFEAAQIDTPRLDAELLVAAATGRTRAQIAAAPEAPIGPAASRYLAELVRRRLRHEPVAYVLGKRAFRNIELAVDSRVLIPRPETEHLVELALELRPATVLDVGTGSGAVALAVANELPETSVVATDIYPDALDVARFNTQALGLEDRVELEFASLPAAGQFDLLLSNLPYVPVRDWMGLDPELKDWEPRGALTPGPTGMEAIEAMLAQLQVSPTVSARAIGLEVGEGQAQTVAELVRRTGFEQVETRRDLAGIERVVYGTMERG